MNEDTTISESRLRRLAAREGYRAVKVRPGRWYAQYGPWMLVDPDSNGVIMSGMIDVEHVTEVLAARRSELEAERV